MFKDLYTPVRFLLIVMFVVEAAMLIPLGGVAVLISTILLVAATAVAYTLLEDLGR